MKPWKEVKRRGVLSPEQPDFMARRLKTIARRHRAWLRGQAAGVAPQDGELDGAGFDSLFD